MVDKLIQLEAKMPKRIAVVGDSMTDVYIHGTLSDCQDGCQKFVEVQRVECPGGADNATQCLEEWESPCECYSNTLRNGPIKTRFLVDGRIVFRHDLDTMDMDDARRRKELHALYEWEPDAILISDYDKGFLTPELIREIISYAERRKIPCVADAKREPGLYKGAILKCNYAYACGHWKRSTGMEVCTRGTSAPLVNLCPIAELPPVPCINHVGAGDCFAAHLTLALALGFSLENAASIAHSAGRVYVQHPHNRPPRPEEIVEDYRS